MFVLAALALAACATAAPPAAVDKTCAFDSNAGGFQLWLEPLDVQPGQVIPLRVLWRDSLGGYTEVPAHCMSRFQLSDARVADISNDQTSLTVREDAPSGTSAIVSAAIGDGAVRGTLHVYRQSEQPLVGVWRQNETECAGRRPIIELVFSADGRYSVTWIPFEVYKDYWGRWRYDAAGSLELTTEGGNYVPADVHSGAVRISGDTLDMTGVSFGAPRDGERCTAPFHRAG